MKQRIVIFITFILMMLGGGLAWAAPKAVTLHPNYEFLPTAEGVIITHDFLIRNDGDAELKILSVLTP